MVNQESENKVQIDKNIPIPNKWPLDEMQVGDSFAVPSTVKRTTITVYVMRYGKKHNKKFSIRKFLGSLRCWRIK